jgi:prepilin-type N-terminal cleavage/methylation domain-containing protein
MTFLLKNKRGVTLVELLAVIVILGIIAAIAVPTIGGLIERQRENAAYASYTNVVEAGRLYAVENSELATFTLDAVIAAGFLSANPFDQAATAISFANSGGSVSITTTGLTINDIAVPAA